MKTLKRLRRKIKYNRKVNSIVMFFFVLFLFMGVGYAYLNATLSITGTGKVTKTTWDVHFENIQPIDGSVSPTSAPVISNDTTVSFSATLNEPGDFYSFYIDLVNAGTIDATIGFLDITPVLTTEQQEYFEYKIKYRGDNSLDVQEGDALSHGDTKTIEILFRYKELDDDDLYPDEDVNFNFTITINAIQGSYNKELSVLRATSSSDRTAYRSDTYRNNIKTITLDDHINPPSGYIESWDVSEGNNGNVMAYVVTNSEDNTMYDLYIQGNGHLYAPEDSTYLLGSMTKLEYINNLTVLDTSNVTNMKSMFGGNISLISINVSNFNTSNVTNMSSMFSGHRSTPSYICSSSLIEIIGLESFDTSNVTDMSGMFFADKKLKSLNLSSFDTSKVTDMQTMFEAVDSIETLDLSNFNTSNVISMFRMFACEYDYTMGRLINTNKQLRYLDLSSFDTSNVYNMNDMFLGNKNLTTLLASSSFNTNNVTDSNRMFSACSSIVGGNGTTYDSNFIDKTYARIDAPGTPGYFTQG